jgi:hypothetical protein
MRTSGIGPKNTFLTKERTEKAAKAYDRGSDQPLFDKPLIDREVDRPATPLERKREERLQREAEESLAARKSRVPAPRVEEPDEYAGMSPAEKSRARGDKIRKALGFKKGGAVKRPSFSSEGRWHCLSR